MQRLGGMGSPGSRGRVGVSGGHGKAPFFLLRAGAASPRDVVALGRALDEAGTPA